MRLSAYDRIRIVLQAVDRERDKEDEQYREGALKAYAAHACGSKELIKPNQHEQEFRLLFVKGRLVIWITFST